MLSKMSTKCAPKFVFFNEKEKNWKDSNDFWHGKLTLIIITTYNSNIKFTNELIILNSLVNFQLIPDFDFLK